MMDIIQEKGKIIGIGQVLQLLLETKFPGMINTIQQTITTLTRVRNMDNDEWTKLLNQLKLVCTLKYFLSHNSLNILEELEQLLIHSYMFIEQMQENKVTIEFSQCSGSVIKSNGDIIVSREGTVQSHLFAKERIVYKHESSVCRGGEIEAGGLIRLEAVGGVSGGEAIIKSNHKVIASKVFMAKICMGKWIEHIQEPLGDVHAYLEKGRLVIKGNPL